MDDALLAVVLARLDTQPLGDDASALLLAACESDSALAGQLAGETVLSPDRANPHNGAEPAGAYLKSVTISGFRGVGPESELNLEPGPGLTLVIGRNGSGKSSFAEGLEVLLTGQLRRWQEQPAAWHQGWRNLHAPDPARIRAELLLEDAGPAVAERSWAAGASLADSAATVQIAGEKRSGIDRLGWRDVLLTYRPFLSHSELEVFLKGPAQLFDLLSSVLGLEDLATAEKRLATERKAREDALRDVNAMLPALLDRLEGIDDERARSCRQALAGRGRDTLGAQSIATGAGAIPVAIDIHRLRALAQLTPPPAEAIASAVHALRQAADELDKSAGTESGHAWALIGLLKAALEHYHAHGEGPCPVCGRAEALGEDWRARTELEVARLEGEAAQARRAHEQAGSARSTIRDLIQPVPSALTDTAIGAADPGPAHSAWAAWAAYPDQADAAGLRLLAHHVAESSSGLIQAVASLSAAAGTELRAREDRWAPVARDIAVWCAQALEAEAAATAIPALKAAITWLKNATDAIRNDRLAPLSDQSRDIWTKLRQESNVDLGAIRLSGSGPRRQVDVHVTVDDAPGSALGVMSQGEINALALSIFLPRATIPASPFRFLVIDDPVQAMDPAKVEGLAQVLHEVARSRQVLVFTHDDRLPDAIRRLGIEARILEVSRRTGSQVHVRPGHTPAERQLKDAQDLCADKALPPDVAARVVPGLCRLAVEATLNDAIRRGQLRAGKRHTDVEAAIESANTLTKRAALAMFGDSARGADVMSRLNNWQPAAATAYKELNRGAHDKHDGSLPSLVSRTRNLAQLISQKLA